MEVGLVRRVDIEEKMRSAYLSYAMSVITARALPDVRDGLKPVQRRILYAMHDMGLRPAQPTRKSARIVGEVLGKYHPHGDEAVYEAMVRMAQDFTMRYMLVEGQGNFGSIDGDGAAAIRYTEARLTRLGEELLADLDKDTVDMTPNFDGSLQEPSVLPAKLPNLLVNGGGGIAVGMATNIPPHNLGEIADAVAYLVDRYQTIDDVTVEDLMRYVRGPDFPTGGSILGAEGIRQAYATGRGSIIMRAQAHMEDLSGGRSAIIVSELPYQVNKATLVERIATLVREGRVEGISDLRDESDRTGMRIVIELKRGVESTPILAALLKYTQMQATFGVNMLALVDGEPRMLSLKRALWHYIEHRVQVIERRARYELQRALERAHILEGLLKALDHLDEVIDTIRRSQTVETAHRNLVKRFAFSDVQAQAILDMQLRRLAALERRKLEDEYKETQARIAYLRDLLDSRAKILALVKEDILALKAAYGDARRTRIVEHDETAAFAMQDMVADEEALVLVTRAGIVRRVPVHRAGEGAEQAAADRAAAGQATLSLLAAGSRQNVLFITDGGQGWVVPVHQLPDVTQQEQGLPLSQLIHLPEGQHPVAALACAAAEEGASLFLATRQGRVKRVGWAEVATLGRTGGAVMGLPEGDAICAALATRDGEEVLLVTAEGKAIRFPVDAVRPQGLAATGMRGMTLQGADLVVAADLARARAELVLVTAHGFAKRTALGEFPAQGRGGQGALAADPTKVELAGPVVAAVVALPAERLVLASEEGVVLVRPASQAPELPRGSWGRIVTRTRHNAMMPLQGEDRVVSMVVIAGSSAPAERRARPTVATPKDEPAAETAKVEAPTAAKSRPSRTKAPAATAVQTTLPEAPAEPPKRSRAPKGAAAEQKTTPAASVPSGERSKARQPAATQPEATPKRSSRAKSAAQPEPEAPTEAPASKAKRSRAPRASPPK